MELFYGGDDGDWVIFNEEPEHVELIGSTEDEYSARLFCAAPEMLKLLESIVSGEFTIPKEIEHRARALIIRIEE